MSHGLLGLATGPPSRDWHDANYGGPSRPLQFTIVALGSCMQWPLVIGIQYKCYNYFLTNLGAHLFSNVQK
jgi:hypothetical protein